MGKYYTLLLLVILMASIGYAIGSGQGYKSGYADGETAIYTTTFLPAPYSREDYDTHNNYEDAIIRYQWNEAKKNTNSAKMTVSWDGEWTSLSTVTADGFTSFSFKESVEPNKK